MKRFLLSLVLLVTAAGCSDSPSEPDPGRPPPSNSQLEEGDFLTLNVTTDQACSDPDNRIGRVVAITDRAIVVADTANPRGGFSDAEYRSLGVTFDTLIYPLAVENFGAPKDIDNNGRAIIFYTRAVNELTPEGQTGFYIGGFFFSRDLFPRREKEGFSPCPTSNEAEMFYMLAPDPRGEVNGHSRSAEFVREVTVTTLMHEFQHLINASRRLYVIQKGGNDWYEEVWLNEGLSHIAEELLGHHAGGFATRQNIDAERITSSQQKTNAFESYHIPNFIRLNAYLENPDTASLIGGVDLDQVPIDNLAVRGATWQFLRYAADRNTGSDVALWKNLVDSELSGLANLRSALGVEPMEWIRDWAVSVYTDDYSDDVASGIDARFTQPSWDFRSIYSALRNRDEGSFGFRLKTRDLDDGTTSLGIPGAGMAFLEFGVAPLQRAEIKVDPNAASCLKDGSALTLEVGEAFLAPGDEAAAICIDGGSLGAEFVYVPFFASEVGSATLALEITATGTRPISASSSASLSRVPAGLLDSRAAVAQSKPDRGWEIQLRQREIRELSPLVPGGGGRIAALNAIHPNTTVPALQSSTGAVDDRLRIAIVRTR